MSFATIAFSSESISEFKNYPNPFTDQTNIEFFSANEERITVEVFDISGKKVNTLLDESVAEKQHLVWNGTDTAGRKLNSGIYFIRLSVNGNYKVSKVILK